MSEITDQQLVLYPDSDIGEHRTAENSESLQDDTIKIKSKRKQACTACSRIRNCYYSAPTEPCKFCLSRGLTCSFKSRVTSSKKRQREQDWRDRQWLKTNPGGIIIPSATPAITHTMAPLSSPGLTDSLLAICGDDYASSTTQLALGSYLPWQADIPANMRIENSSCDPRNGFSNQMTCFVEPNQFTTPSMQFPIDGKIPGYHIRTRCNHCVAIR